MKNKTNLYMYTINIVLAIFCLIYGTIFSSYWKDSKVPPNYFSEDFKTFMFCSDIDPSKELPQFNEIEEAMKLEADSFMIQKETEYGYSWVFNYYYDFPIHLLSGRKFNDEDLSEQRNTALVSDKIQESIYEDDNKKFIDIGQNRYEVIGIYKYEENKINRNSELYLNMASENFLLNDASMIGSFNIDAKNKTEKALQTLQKNYEIQEISNDLDFFERLTLVMNSQFFPSHILIMIFVVFILMLLFSILFWIQERKKEIYIRILCGATKSDLIELLIKKYFQILIISHLLVGTTSFFCFYNIEVLIQGFIFNLLFMIIVVSVFLFKYEFQNKGEMR